MAQTKIENFFTVKINHSQTIKKCFVYDPSIPQATFIYEPLETDRFISTESGIKLYYRPFNQSSNYVFPRMNVCNAPLLISNLQKAVRRRDAPIAVQSALALIQQHPSKILRRLPIIYVEDVTVMDSFPIVVWLMMAEKDYELTNTDIDYLLNIVWSLALHDTYYDNNRDIEKESETHEQLQTYSNADILLALHYRSLYGGMKGDMRMLVNAIDDFKNQSIESTIYHRVEHSEIPCEIIILIESIDFHPYPQLLTMLQPKTKMNKEKLQEFIWYAESGVNVRKPKTIEMSNEYKKQWEWRVISKFLDDTRHHLVA